jgi:4-hydroxy-3-polyprenylbenzoate decarboxylase
MGADSVDEVANELGALMKAKPPTSFKEAIKLLSLALDLRHAKPKTVKSGSCKDVIHKYDAPAASKSWPKAPDVNNLASFNTQPPTLANIPILRCWPLDGGRFITLPCVVTRDPDTGERNLGMYRIQIYDDKTTGMHWQLQKVAARHGRRYYEKGERMPVAIFIGGDPMFPFAATAPLPDGLDEFLLAGYLRKKSVELVKCETNDLEVPANADFVIEGYVARPSRCATKAHSATTPATTRCPSRIPCFTLPPSRTAKTPSIPPPSSASRRWKTSTSAARP